MQIILKKQPLKVNTDNGKHEYINTETGEYFTSVSKILKIRNKPFLIPWNLKLMYQYLKSNWDLNKKYTALEKEELLQAAKDSAKREIMIATEFGASVHKWIQEYTDGENPQPLKDEQQQKCVQKFLDWEKNQSIEWLCGEVPVANFEHRIAGTFDRLAIINERFTLVDFKVSKNISDDYFLQTAAYKFMIDPLIENFKEIEDRMIVHIPKDDHPVNAFIVDSKYDFDIEVFLHLREVNRYNYYIQNHFMEKYGIGVTHYHE